MDSPAKPSEVYEIHFASRRLEKLTVGQQGGSEDDDYETNRVAVSSQDGTMIPLSLVRKRSVNQRRDRIPVVLAAYGAYGQSVDMSYNPAWEPLLSRGYVIAFAHIRGGGELGARWHAQGRRLLKTRGVQDYLCCARALKQYLLGGNAVRLIAKAFSAGGVAVASAVNRQPDLFDDLVLSNAFLDVYQTMRNPSLALTEHEWDEYGNPALDKAVDDTIRSYCPVQTVPAGNDSFPRTLLLATLMDEVVPYWNALIYAKALRMAATSTRDIGVIIEADVGHDLGDKLIHFSSLEVAFILSEDDRAE